MRPSEWLTQHHWIRGEFYALRDGREYACVLGAISHAAADIDTITAQTVLLSTLCHQKYRKMIADVNDTELASKTDAVELLEEMECIYYQEGG